MAHVNGKKVKGNPLVPVRFDTELLAWIDEQIERCNRTRRDEPYDRSSFIRAAVRERRDKYARAAKSSKKAKGVKAISPAVAVVAPVPEM